MSIFIFQCKLGIFILVVDDSVLVLLAFLEELVYFEDVRADFSLDFGDSHEVVCLFVFSVVQRENQFPYLIYEHQGRG